MSKRFMDTRLFDNSWFSDLSYDSKMIWFFLERSCDHAGIWEIDIPQMRRKLGNKDLNLAAFLEEINNDYSRLTGEPVKVNRVMIIHDNSRLWLTDFISEQYEKGRNGINTAVPAIKSVVNRLKDEGMLEFALKEGFVRIQNSHSADNPDQKEKALFDEEPDPINNPAAKGSEPLERDKDKDKDKVMYGSNSNKDLNLNVVLPSNSPVEINHGGKTLPDMSGTVTSACNEPADSVSGADNSLVQNLFTTYWGKKPHTPHEEVLTAQFILDYGYEEVKLAFGEAVNHSRFTLAYVKGILQKRRQRAMLDKLQEEKKAELLRLAEKGSQERKQGIKLNLIQNVYGVHYVDP